MEPTENVANDMPTKKNIYIFPATIKEKLMSPIRGDDNRYGLRYMGLV